MVAPTVETVMDLLYDIRGHWKEIAEGLGFDEDMIEVSGDDSGVSDVVSGHSGHQTPATSHDDANRGHKVVI